MLILWAGLAQAATWTVDVAGGADFTSINEAMLASSHGDVIEVADGVYAEPVYFSTHDVQLISVGGRAVIDGTGFSEPAVTMLWNSDATEMVDFELIADEQQPALYIYQGSPIIKGLTIGNHVSSNWGPFLVAAVDSDVVFEDCIFEDNLMRGQFWLNGGSATFRSCTFSRNDGSLVSASGSLVMEDCLIQDNTEYQSLIAQSIKRDQTSTVELTGNTWKGNTGRILEIDADSVTIIDAQVEGSLGSEWIVESSGAVQIEGAWLERASLRVSADDVTVKNLHISDQSSTDMHFYVAEFISFGPLLLEDSEFTRNTTSTSGRAFRVWAQDAELRRVKISDSESDMGVADVTANNVILEDFVLSGNQGLTAALEVRADQLTCEGLVATDNIGELNGAVELYVDVATVTGAQVLRNTAISGAAGLNFNGDDLTIKKSDFCGNKGHRGGGLNAWVTGTLEVRNNAFWGNEASEKGGASYLRGSGRAESKLSNNTFVANSAPQAAGAYIDLDNGGTINNVFAHHPGDALVTGYPNYTGFWDNEQDYPDPWGSQNEQHDDPLFVDYTPDGKCNDKLWTLPGSPYRDAGDPSIRDLDGSVSDLGIGGGPGASSANFDGDGDGVPLNQDCDDADAQAGGGEEVPYDGLDNDCDETTPDDDLDGDGFGVDEDCDDQDAEVYPSTEDCTEEDSGARDDEEYFELGESRCSCAQSPTAPIFWPALILGLAVLRRRTRPTQTMERPRTDR